MEIIRRVNDQLKKLSLEEAIKHTLTTDPATTAYNNLIMWQHDAIRNECKGRGYDITLLGLMIEKCEKRVEELGIQL